MVDTDPAALTPAQQLARSVADDIERYGHYKRGAAIEFSFNGPCCVYINPSHRDADPVVMRQFNWLLANHVSHALLSVWSDNTPTEEVLATLRSL